MIVDAEFRDLIPPLSHDEREELERSILSEGCRDAIVLWGDTIIDGHNRYEICTAHDIQFDTIQRDFASREQAIEWIIRNQFGRRNITAFVRSELALRLKDVLAAEAKKRQVRKPADFVPYNCTEQKDTREQIADSAGVSTATISRVEAIKRDAPEPIIEAARNNDISINMAHEFTKMDEPEREEIVERIELGEEPKAVITEVKKRPHVANNGGDNEWYTPAEYIESARSVMGSIDVDPASNDMAQEVVKAGTYYTAETNGLDKEWHGNVWLNPPYAADLVKQFAAKLKDERETYESAIVLVNNATETRWFLDIISVASAVCFPTGRVKFYAPDGRIAAPLQGQAIIYIGDEPTSFRDEFSRYGWTAEL